MRRIIIAAIALAAALFTQQAGASRNPARLELGESYRFAVISDCRSGDRAYARIVDGLVRRDPDFVVFVGDVLPTMRDEEQWENFERLSAPIKVPFYMAPGNHDIEDERSLKFWLSRVDRPGTEAYYSFTAGEDLFVVLSSVQPGSDRRISGRQLEWLKRTLDPARYKRQFVFVHHPLFLWKGAFHEGGALDLYPAERDRLHRLFVEKRVDIVFHGHEHTYRRMDLDGVRYIITGGAGSPPYPLFRSTSFHHFVIVEVKGPWMKIKVIDKKGYLRDEFTMGEIPLSSRERAMSNIQTISNVQFPNRPVIPAALSGDPDVFPGFLLPQE